MFRAAAQIPSELTRAEATLKELKARLERTRGMLEEQRTNRFEIEGQRHTLERTGDINRLMEIKQRSLALDKSITDLRRSEAETLERIESAKRYLSGLRERLNRLRQEANSLSEKLEAEEVPPDVLPQVQTTLRRVKMQIEMLAGAEYTTAIEPAYIEPA
jgi:chromosome segregation ATPase